MIPIIIIRYGELTTKSKNRIDFIKQLKTNIKIILQDFKDIKIVHFHDRMEITDLDLALTSPIINILTKVFGISSLSAAFRIEKDIAQLKTKVLELVNQQDRENFKTFKLFVTRSDKTFKMSSDEITRVIAPIILYKTSLTVDVTNPDLKINIKINQNDIYLVANKINGAGGFPVGSSGKVVLLLSGGIDSPVAAYKLMKRGLQVQYLHFATPPFTLPAALKKVQKLVEILAPYNAGSKELYICNFTNLQNEISHIKKESYRITLMRRMFVRIANIFAEQHNFPALATGEAIGQVASQTLASINVINNVAALPILRSLITEDKVDIINFAKKIGTYETSILPFADCCSLFVPKNPVTQPKLYECENLENQLKQLIDWEQLVFDTVESIEKLEM
ncbi:tRNA uracil 4-sulfurtransferase ThiI [Spiroplasma sp. AdecLV25b]|uniref:tRNA uracil 4-sulfurtransferase ThiI n=1 Tax=Spiroplasma sp. AdecLV25b TaxID=3027162 RepID=UPI0027E0C4F0|nr:tRNA uracil 4-sulfurtransferase ThiI [Spiroplasma sp. AdecLV25b]